MIIIHPKDIELSKFCLLNSDTGEMIECGDIQSLDISVDVDEKIEEKRISAKHFIQTINQEIEITVDFDEDTKESIRKLKESYKLKNDTTIEISYNVPVQKRKHKKKRINKKWQKRYGYYTKNVRFDDLKFKRNNDVILMKSCKAPVITRYN